MIKSFRIVTNEEIAAPLTAETKTTGIKTDLNSRRPIRYSKEEICNRRDYGRRI